MVSFGTENKPHSFCGTLGDSSTSGNPTRRFWKMSVDLADLTWRDVLLGDNMRPCDVQRGLAMARTSSADDAKWLVSLFSDTSTIVAAADVIRVLETEDTNPRALCFRGFLQDRNPELIRRAADLGDALAMGWLAEWSAEGTAAKFEWAQKAAALKDRRALFRLGICNNYGIETAVNAAKAKVLYRESAERGYAEGQVEYGRVCDPSSPERFLHWGRACRVGRGMYLFLSSMVLEVLAFEERGERQGVAVFAIGEALVGQIDSVGKTLFRREVSTRQLQCAERAAQWHEQWTREAHEAGLWWLRAALRGGLVADMRLAIGRLIWTERMTWK